MDSVHIKGHWVAEQLDENGNLLSRTEYDNIICAGMDTLLAGWLNGEGPIYGNVYCAVGTSAVAPAYADIQLGAELARAILAVNVRAVNVVQFQFFYSPGIGTGTLVEAGVFVNATGAANSGTLVNHVAIAEVKGATVTLILSVSFTIL